MCASTAVARLVRAGGGAELLAVGTQRTSVVSGSAAAGPHRATILDCQELRSRSLVAAAAPLLRATRRRRLPAIGLARASSCSTSAWGNQLELLDWFWTYSVSSLTYMSAGSRLAHLDGYMRVLEGDK